MLCPRHLPRKLFLQIRNCTVNGLNGMFQLTSGYSALVGGGIIFSSICRTWVARALFVPTRSVDHYYFGAKEGECFAKEGRETKEVDPPS